jgi:hypothetical protein
MVCPSVLDDRSLLEDLSWLQLLAEHADVPPLDTSLQSQQGPAPNHHREKIPTENHLKIRSVADAGAKWEVNLQRVHGLTDEEACVGLSIVAKYLPKDEFPPPSGNLFVELAKEGWQHSKQLDRLIKAYPECGDQTNIDGVWIML